MQDTRLGWAGVLSTGAAWTGGKSLGGGRPAASICEGLYFYTRDASAVLALGRRWGHWAGPCQASFFFFFFSVRLISLFASLQPTFSLLVLFRGEGGASLLGGVMGRYGGLGGVCTTESLE